MAKLLYMTALRENTGIRGSVQFLKNFFVFICLEKEFRFTKEDYKNQLIVDFE